MEFLPKSLTDYIEGHTTEEPEILKRISRHTHAKVLMPRMLSGHFQGRMLAMISQMIRPKFILEIGTYTGYSALCLLEGIQPDGHLHTIDINEELESAVREFFAAAGATDKISYHIGDAREIIPKIDIQFDIVFIDADKINYSTYFHQVIDKVGKGGFIIADNVLWSGKVIEPVKSSDKDTIAIQQFNKMVQEDSRVDNVLLPIRDGLLIMRKI